MVCNPEQPKGIWFEINRNRWRVKLFCDGILFHRSYHKNYNDALIAWHKAKKQMVRPKPEVPIHLSSDINRFLCQPLLGAARSWQRI